MPSAPVPEAWRIIHVGLVHQQYRAVPPLLAPLHVAAAARTALGALRLLALCRPQRLGRHRGLQLAAGGHGAAAHQLR